MTTSYKEDIQIDIHDIEGDWIKQSSLYMKYSELHANATASRDRLKQELEVERAEVFARVKKQWKSLGFEKKPTDAEANKFVDQDELIDEIANELIEANKEVNILLSAKIALDHKKRALENITSLMIHNLFADPKEGVNNKGFEGELMARKNKRELGNSPALQKLKEQHNG
jgi:hypothetical protein